MFIKINCRDRKNLQVKNQKGSSLIVNVGGVLSELPRGSRGHAAEERQPAERTSWSAKNTRRLEGEKSKNKDKRLKPWKETGK